jgi:Flp pilus assembly protein CpaB
MAQTVLEDVAVLSVRDELIHQTVSQDAKNKMAEGILLMLAVTPSQAEKMSLAEKNSQGDL